MESKKVSKKVDKSVKVAHTPVLSLLEDANDFEVSDASALWTALSSNEYDFFQPFLELIDNAISAIITPGDKGKIYVNFDFDSGIGTIEHSGGNTFPLSPAEIAKCFTHGSKRVTSLSEHGCGLKSSLAILDKENAKWKIWIKYIECGEQKVKSVSAPYSNKMKLANESCPWPGFDKAIANGTLITFPINKAKFASLYTTKDPKMDDVHERVAAHFSHIWMLQEQLLSNDVEIFYNKKRVNPFSFLSEDVYSKVASIKKKEFTLETGGKAFITDIRLKEDARKIPGSNKFKVSMSSNGAYLFKNGRFIEHINNDSPARGNLYTRIFGRSPHNSHNGMIILVNLVGEQHTLPPTVSTKNQFQSHLLFSTFIDELAKHIESPSKGDAETEDSIVEKYKRTNESALKAAGFSVAFEREKKFTLQDGNLTPPIDLVRIMSDVTILEFKRSIKPSSNDIQQLFFNWILVCDSKECEGKTVKPILVLAATEVHEISSTVKSYLAILEAKHDFKPEIWDDSNKKLYPVA